MESKAFPLYERFPALAVLPRVRLTDLPAPVERIVLDSGASMWLKRDDRNAPLAAGNKVRALEFLLAGVHTGDLVRTAGAEGSTHVYATAVHAARLGARTAAIRWPQVMHPIADAVAREAERHCAAITHSAWTPAAFGRIAAWWVDPRTHRDGGRYIPIGGSTPLGILGHVNAGLELAAQIAEGVLPEPTHVVVPLGSGGTAAGLALGLGIGGVRARVVAARVAPRAVANGWRVAALVARTRRLIRRLGRASGDLPAVPVVVDHSVYGGAYGQPLAGEAGVAALFNRAVAEAGAQQLTLDATYSAKAGASALSLVGAGGGGGGGGEAGSRVLLWVTFDGRAFGGAGDTRTSGEPNSGTHGTR